MKVPLYDELPRRQTGGTGAGLSVQASSQALVGSNALSDLGDALVEFGFEKARIKNESQAAEAITAAQQEMQQFIDDTNRTPVGSVDEGAVLNGLDRIVNNYAAGLVKNQQTGRFFLEAKQSRQLFQTAVQKSLSKYKLGFRQSHGEKVLEVAKEGAYRQVIDTTNEIIEMTDQSEAILALDNLISPLTNLIDGTTKYSGLIPDALAKGHFSVKESIEVSSSALSNIVSGRVRKRFLDKEGNTIPEPENIVQQLRAGNLEDQVTLDAFNLLSENERAALLTNLLNEASQLENVQFEREAAEENKVKADNDELKRIIINHDPKDPESAVEAAFAFEELRRKNGFATVADINAFRDFLNPDDDKEGDKSTTAAYTALTNLDANNQLTVDAINRVYASGQLTNADYKFFMKAFTGEVAQGYRNAQKLIKNSVNFDVAAANLNDTNELKLELASEYLIKLDKWANTVPTTTDLESGGQGAGYQAYRRYAIELSKELKEDVFKVVQERFDGFVINFSRLAAALFEGPEFSGIELDLSTGDRRQAILDYLAQIKATPGGQSKLKSALGFKAQVEVFLQNYASEEGLE